MTESKKVTLAEIAEYERLKADEKRIKTRLDNIGKRIKEQFNPGEQVFEIEGESYETSIIEKRGTLNAKLFERDFPEKDFGSLYKSVPDNDKILSILGEDALEYFGVTVALTIKKVGSEDEDA